VGAYAVPGDAITALDRSAPPIGAMIDLREW
jgi:hypothetical protein